MIYIYKIEFFYNLIDLNSEWVDKISEIDKEVLMNLSAESFFDYEINDKMYVCYVIVDELEIKQYFEVLDKYSINYKSSNISNIILNGELDVEHELIKYVNSENSIKYDFFIEDTNNWILENLDIDNVLDKISKIGMINLSQIEKEFLKNYNK